MFDLIDEALDQMAFLIQMFVVVPPLSAAGMGWNHRNRATVHNHFEQIIRVVRPVADDVVDSQTVGEQGVCLRYIMPLAAGQQKAERIAQAIYADVDFGAESAATPSERLRCLPTVFLGAPAAHG